MLSFQDQACVGNSLELSVWTGKKPEKAFYKLLILLVIQFQLLVRNRLGKTKRWESQSLCLMQIPE